MAGKVRRAAESDEFDLANYDQSRCDELAKGAFSQDFPLSEMVRLSFVVGGGKLVRQKYSDDLPKLFMGSLTAAGYVNDESAAVEVGSAGKFKYQHDTNKNLKFVHVFPKLAPREQGGGEAAGEEEEEPARPVSPEERLLRCGEEQFERVCAEGLPTYGQKKNALDFLKDRIAKWTAIDEKVVRCEKLDAEEDELYNSDISIDDVQKKEKALGAKMQAMIEAGQLTSEEQKTLLSSLQGKLDQLEKGGKKAPQKLLDTIKQVKDTSPASLPPLKYADKIRHHHKRIGELTKLEALMKGKLGSIEQTKAIGEKPEHEEALAEFTQRSRGWFEDDEVFQKRLEACMRAAASAPKKPSGGGYAAAAAAAPRGGSASGGFTTVSGSSRAPKAKASAVGTRNAFTALDR